MKTLAAAASLLALAACTAAEPAPAPSAAAAAAPRQDQAAALAALFQDSDEASLRRNPLEALVRGDLRYAAEFGDYVTPAFFEAERSAVEADLARLRSIDRDSLDQTNRLAYDVFRWDREQSLRAFQPEILALTAVRPIDHKRGLQSFYPDVSSGRGAAPFRTALDYENNLRRLDGFIRYLDNSILRFREGMASGVVQPRLVVDVVLGQFDNLIAQGVEGSTFYGPVKAFPDTIPAAEHARLTAAYRAAIGERLIPALRRVRTFLADEYRPVARESVGLSEMQGGAALYALRIEQQTTLPLTADEVHAIGLREVGRLRTQMEAVARRAGHTGSLADFFQHIRTDPRFKPASREALTQRFHDIGRRVDTRVLELFPRRPRTQLLIEPVPAYRERSAAGGSYSQGSPDGARPGTFYFNAYDLPSRTIEGNETLFLHEGTPGHHFQISLAQENEALPNFMRFGGNTAFVEGWAHYAETMGPELGLFTDPIQLFGHLDAQMFRAIRLVVDTGLHAKGWSRTRAVDYMLANSATGRTAAESEIDRYIANPGQALAYKIGQLKISELRARAERALGPRFDIREFHAQVLDTGALPLVILERKIDDWIASRRAD
ncbi:MAG TPA: DUF885 domain-containing protein [Allosphingosinicella sp.]|nr:DUF885 domain-containing protein [Allosphingosinicella sp.]